MYFAQLKKWLAEGTYPRLFLPILVIMVAVIFVRYHFLLNSEIKESQSRVTNEVTRMGHLLAPTLAQRGQQIPELQNFLDEETRLNPDLESIVWRTGSIQIRSSNDTTARAAVPTWFLPLVESRGFDKQFDVTLPDGQQASLLMTVRKNASSGDIWKVVSSQLTITALNVVTILVLLTLMLRANARMLNRLSNATRGFQSGRLNTRMAVQGTLEIQTVANTFNGMASQIEQLVTSLQETQCEQADQLHFTRQLVDSLPLPVFVRSARGVCLVVNRAWEDMFGVRSEAVVGFPMPSNFSPLDDTVIDITSADNVGSGGQQSQTVYQVYVRGQTRYVLYFKAPFTSRDGIHLGTIATLVDVTHRETEQPTGLWSHTQSGLPSIH